MNEDEMIDRDYDRRLRLFTEEEQAALEALNRYLDLSPLSLTVRIRIGRVIRELETARDRWELQAKSHGKDALPVQQDYSRPSPCKHCGCDARYDESFWKGLRITCANTLCGVSTPYRSTGAGDQQTKLDLLFVWNRSP
jgi:hypothetical protein